MIHKFIIELTDDTKGYEDGVDYLERVYGAEELTDVPIIHGKAELELHDKAIRNKAIDDFANACKSNTLCQTFGLRQCDINKIAEQLKVGGTDE